MLSTLYAGEASTIRPKVEMAMGSVGLVLRLITSVILITAAVLAREAPTAFVILLTLSVGNLVLTIAQYRRQHPGPG